MSDASMTEQLEGLGLLPAAATSNTDPSAVAAAISDPDNGIKQAPAPIPAAVTVTNNPVSVNPVTNKFATALLQVALVALTAWQAIANAPLDIAVLIQLGVTILGATVVYLVPLFSGVWAGLWKTGVAIVTAGAVALVPFLTQGDITWQNWIVVGGAALTALATEVGVQVRMSTAAHVS